MCARTRSLAPHVNRILPLRFDCKDCLIASLNWSSGYTCSMATESDPSVTRSPSLWYISWIAVRGALRSQLASQNPWRLRPDGSLTTIGKHQPRTRSMTRFSIGSSRPVASRFTKDTFLDEIRTAVQEGNPASRFVYMGELFLRP